MKTTSIKIINQSNNPLPAYETMGSAGMDVRANLSEPLMLKPLQRVLVSTGLFIELPQGFEAQIRPRSGLAIHNGITCLNSPGTIDSDYRGEIMIVLINLSSELQTINHGNRIAQMIIQEVTRATWNPVTLIAETERGNGSFGHTGKN